jgi:hypothetical protein
VVTPTASNGGKRWQLGLGVQILSEWVLKWLDEIDDRAATDAVESDDRIPPRSGLINA